MLSSNDESLTSSTILPFVSFSYLIVSNISSTLWNRSGESAYSCLLPVLGQNIQYFTIKFDVTHRFFIDILRQMMEIPFYS